MDRAHDVIRKISTDLTKKEMRGLRGVAIDSELDLIFVASPDTNQVLVFVADIEREFENVYNVTLDDNDSEPISVLLDVDRNVLYISDRINNKVFAYDYHQTGVSLKWVTKFNEWLQHPTGLAIDGQHHLFVISQAMNRYDVFLSFCLISMM